MSKGAGTAISSVIIIILIIGLAYFFFSVLKYGDQKELDMNLREAEILRTGNTFYFTERSLNFTWFISTIQDIFRAGEKSLGVTYWFNRSADGSLFTYKPGIENLTFYLNKTMRDYYTSGVENSTILSNGVNVIVSEIGSELNYTENPLGTDNITSNVTEYLSVSYGETESRSTINHIFVIPTYFSDMLAAGRLFVDKINYFSDEVLAGSYRYDTTYTYSSYHDHIKEVIDARIETILPILGITGIILNRTDLVSYPIVPSTTNGFNIGNILPQGGLILNYIYSARFAEDNIGYYYHDEANNVFTKRPFFLDVRANDTVPILDCSSNNGARFNFLGTNDTICYQSSPPERDDTYPELYTCNKRLIGQVTGNKLRTGNCLHNNPLGNGASGMECSSSGFMNCGEKVCWYTQCGAADVDAGTQDYYLKTTCMESCTEGIGCDCTCPEFKPAGSCSYFSDPCGWAFCSVSDPNSLDPPCYSGAPSCPCGCSGGCISPCPDEGEEGGDGGGVGGGIEWGPPGGGGGGTG